MIAIQGYFMNNQFVPFGNISIPERKRAIVTILDESVPDILYQNQKAWGDFIEAIQGIKENVNGIDNDRLNFSRVVDL